MVRHGSLGHKGNTAIGWRDFPYATPGVPTPYFL